MIILIIANLIVALSAFILVKAFFSEQTLAERILSGFLFFWAQIILVGQICGMLGLFTLAPILAAHCVILAVLLFFTGKLKLTALELNVSFLFGNKPLLFSAAVFSGFFISVFFFNLLNPPLHLDCLHYHIAFPAFWIQQGNLNNPVIAFGVAKGVPALSCITYYPINAHLFFAWLMLPLKNAMLADVGEAPFYFAGILLIYSILRKYGLLRSTALFCGFLWVLIPTVLKQLLYGSNIDVICAVGLLFVLNSLLILKESFRVKNIILFGVSVGVFIGTKSLNFVWLAAFAPICVYYWIVNCRNAGYRRCSIYILSALFFAVLLGGFMYIKNMIFTGNPAYPIAIKIFGKEIFKGIVDNAQYSRIVRVTAVKFTDILWKEGLGGQFLLFILPATFIPLVCVKFMKNMRRPVVEYLLLFVTPLLMLAVYYIVIKTGWVRYIFPYLAVGIIVAAVFSARFRWGERYIYIAGMVSIIASMTKLANGFLMTASLLVTAAALIVFLVLARAKDLKKVIRMDLKTWFLIFILGGAFLWGVNEKYNNEEYARYPFIFSKKETHKRDIGIAWQWLNENTGRGKRIAFVGRSETYPLFGRALKNKLFYVPVNNKPLAAYASKDAFYRGEKDYTIWMSNLSAAGIDYVFIAQAEKEDDEFNDTTKFSLEETWCRQKPDKFELVFSNSLTRIYRVLRK